MSNFRHQRSVRYDRTGSAKRKNQGQSHQPKKDYIYPSKFVQAAKNSTQEKYVPINSFANFNLHPLIAKNLQSMGYTDPSPIQDQAIPGGLLGKNVVGIANTGTGKTAAFAVPMLHRLMNDINSWALILAPTRELAQQIEDQCRLIAKGSGLDGALLIGGMAMVPQLRELRYNPRIVIGTPGRH